MIWPPLLVQMALTASGMARFLSVSLLILSVAPWASIYTLVLSQYAQSYQEVQEEEATTLLTMLQNNNVTMEDLLTRVFRDRMTYDRDAFMLPNTLHHWTIVLPWSISLVMGIIIPFVLSLFSCLHPRDEFRLDPDEDPWISRHRKERRLKRLVVACEEYRKVRRERERERFGGLASCVLVAWTHCSYACFILDSYTNVRFMLVDSGRRRQGRM
jgi:hypothetical protein